MSKTKKNRKKNIFLGHSTAYKKLPTALNFFLGHSKVYSLNVWQINVKNKKKLEKNPKIYFSGPPYSLQKASYSPKFLF